MDVDKAIALVTAAGIELTDRRRTAAGKGWQLSFSNGAVLEVADRGKLAASGKGADAVLRALGLPGKAHKNAKPSGN